ncbi:L domain-like protein [Conidiobolus coronatus NRRL 28638]|uniref:L domain-like protein n=1 Tax=Conidiobolus coronatus (strain ATCC 28846 / CBS 209.66 / NRRL 28638) TaxID=796925 RepID=A0A137NQW7_CONC2|nr:L domain-like protein [Conidiobolus coronatus NRRL 28638]|eukprot:KXN65114.1 L domain-like protein [Conidiobolus coronatus NRRL 28638]
MDGITAKLKELESTKGAAMLVMLKKTELKHAIYKLERDPDDFFTQLPSLLKLVLDNNLFVFLPDSIQSLTSLELLSCSICDLSSLPNDMSNLQSLVSLDLHGNNLKSIPTSVWTLKNLINLNVGSNLLEKFPNPQTQSKKSADNRLDDVVFEPLSYLTEISQGSLSHMSQLNELYLSDNQFTSLPSEEFVCLRNLQILYLNGNKLNTLDLGSNF